MVQSLYKKLTPGLKNYMRNLENFQTSSRKSWKLKFNGHDTLQEWYILSGKTLYTEDLSNIPFIYLCKSSPNGLCHFLNYKSFLTTESLYIFLIQTLHTFYKSSPSKWKLSDLPLLILKFTKFLMSFLETRISYSSNFASLFSFMRLTLLNFLI